MKSSSCLIVGCLILFIASSAIAGTVPGDVAIYLSDEAGHIYVLKNDDLTGWPLFIGLPFRAADAYRSIVHSPGDGLYLADPCAGRVVHVDFASLAPRTVYDAAETPVPECTVESCDPYAGRLSPIAIAIGPTNALLLFSSSGGCPRGDLRTEGIWRLEPPSPGGPTSSLPTRCFPPLAASGLWGTLTPPVTMAVVPVESGDPLLVLAAHDGTAGRIYGIALDGSLVDVESLLPIEWDQKNVRTVLVVHDGGFVWLDAVGRLRWGTPAGTVLLTSLSRGLELLAADRDPAGNLYVVARGDSGGQLYRFAPDGELVDRMPISLHPAAMAVVPLAIPGG